MPKTDAWMIVFEEAGKRALTFTGEGAEVAAHTTYARLNGNWNMHLFQTIEPNPALVDHTEWPRYGDGIGFGKGRTTDTF